MIDFTHQTQDLVSCPIQAKKAQKNPSKRPQNKKRRSRAKNVQMSKDGNSKQKRTPRYRKKNPQNKKGNLRDEISTEGSEGEMKRKEEEDGIWEEFRGIKVVVNGETVIEGKINAKGKMHSYELKFACASNLHSPEPQGLLCPSFL